MEFNEEKKLKYKLTAKIVDREEGVQEYEDVKMIRVVSNNHNLLIMEDYLPVIGELNGFVELVFDNSVVTKKDIHGFYMHKKNQFTLVVESYTNQDNKDGEQEEAK